MVIAGNDKGNTGRVLEVYPKENKVLVEGVNLRKKHERPNPNNQQGGIVEIERPVHYSNVMLVDSDGNPTKIGVKREETKSGRVTLTRYAKTNGKDI